MTDLTKLKMLTEELAKEMSGENSNGQIFELLKQYFDGLESFVSILDKDGNVLYLNKCLSKRLRELGHQDANCYINKPVIEIDPKKMIHQKTVMKCIKTKKVTIQKGLKSKYSEKIYDLVCMPLKYDGVSGVIEIWEEASD